MRVSMEVCLKQLIIAGNALLFFPPKEGGIKVYKLNSYVVQRDFVGHPIQMITCDKLAINTLPYEVLGQLDIDLSTKRGDEWLRSTPISPIHPKTTDIIVTKRSKD